MRASQVNFSARDGQVSVTAKATPITDLATMISRQLRRPVLDQTGLTGKYDWTLQWTSGAGLGGGPLAPAPESGDAPNSSGPSIFTALQEQLGLRLESAKGPVDTIVIEYIEKPSGKLAAEWRALGASHETGHPLRVCAVNRR